MRCAWLDHGDRWKRTESVEETLDHQGRMIVCDTEEDERTISEQVRDETEKFVTFCRGKHTLVLSDVPIFETLCDKAEKLARKGSPVRLIGRDFTAWRHWGDLQVHLPDPRYYHDCKDAKRGLILRKGPNDLYELTFDTELWDKAVRQLTAQRKRERERPEVSKSSMQDVANQLAESMGFSRVENFRVEHLLLWVSAHDELLGRRATNRVIVHLARSWAADYKRYKNRFKRWTDLKVLDRLDARLRKAVRAKAS